MTKKLIIYIAIMINSLIMPLAQADEPTGEYGYYWYVNSSIKGSTHFEAAMAECALYAANNPSCSGVALQSETTTSAVYKRALSNGSLSGSTVTVSRSTCSANEDGIASCQEGYGQSEPECPQDEYPADVLVGTTMYYNCDRPLIKECEGGIFIRQTEFCPTTNCYDFDTCLQEKRQNQASCTSEQVEVFNYTSPTVNSLACEDIESTSPDSPANGGNADGNANNDPNSAPQTGVGAVDVATLANAIDGALQNDFSNVERATREGASKVESAINQSSTNAEASAQAIKDAIQALGISTGEGFEDTQTTIDNAIAGLGSTNTTGLGEVKDAVEQGNQTLEEIADKLEACVSTSTETCPDDENPVTLSYMNSVFEALKGQLELDADEAVDERTEQVEEMEQGDIFGPEMSSSFLSDFFAYFVDIWPHYRTCIPLEVGTPNQPFYFVIDCESSDKFKEIFGMIIGVFTIMTLINILFTSITPRPFSK
ncbi:MAG: hypothetical protein P1U47_17155 [Zhongshania sp.]|uniref:hypothetical protein n=1 Tax=Zhongshania sp. TaxID=1971902 RepID=UPI002612C21C|nr:hypothetical protein [Zhongshania sp.]MDF1694101.1 hypothetical protein [Zhongshania sp.]